MISLRYKADILRSALTACRKVFFGRSWLSASKYVCILAVTVSNDEFPIQERVRLSISNDRGKRRRSNRNNGDAMGILCNTTSRYVLYSYVVYLLRPLYLGVRNSGPAGGRYELTR